MLDTVQGSSSLCIVSLRVMIDRRYHIQDDVDLPFICHPILMPLRTHRHIMFLRILHEWRQGAKNNVSILDNHRHRCPHPLMRLFHQLLSQTTTMIGEVKLYEYKFEEYQEENEIYTNKNTRKRCKRRRH